MEPVQLAGSESLLALQGPSCRWSLPPLLSGFLGHS